MRAPFNPLASRNFPQSANDLPALALVASSRESVPVKALSIIAASVTVRHMGPAVSWLCAMGMMPARLINPKVGLMPTSEFAFAGQTTEPSVSVPIPIAERFAATAEPVAELEPQGHR